MYLSQLMWLSGKVQQGDFLGLADKIGQPARLHVQKKKKD